MTCKFFYSRVLWLFGLIVFFCSNASVFADTCPNGIIAIWSLEESYPPYEDWPDSKNNAICNDQCPTRIGEERTGVGAANRFNNSGLRVPGGTAFNWAATDSFSIELWVRNTGAAGADRVLIGRTAENFEWNLSLLSNGAVGFHLDDSNDPISLTSTKVLSSPQSSLGPRWHHVAVVRNGENGMTRLFVDGRREGDVTQIFTGDFSSDDASLAIGWSGDNNNPRNFNGDLDEVAVYRSLLTEEDIRSHYYLARHYCGMYDDLVHIMPLGNSITWDDWRGNINRSDGDRTAYRYHLWQSLTNEHYLFDFVGSRESGGNSDPAFDPSNAGFPGITAAELLLLLQTSYNEAPQPDSPGWYTYDGGGQARDPSLDRSYLLDNSNDVILLHIGTNGIAVENADDVTAILNEIDQYSTNVTVVVARIIHREEDFENGVEIPNNATHQYNDAVEEIVNQRIAAGDKLLMVDMEHGAGITYVSGEGNDMHDDLHPSDSGYQKMAAQWHARLQEFLPQLQPPKITSKPVTEAIVGKEYRYQVTAEGSPPPQFRLTTAPDGMAIDPNSGLITWTASDTVDTSVDVGIEAYNTDPENADREQVVPQKFSISIKKDDGGDSSSGKSSNSGGCFIHSMVPSDPPQSVFGLGIRSFIVGRNN
jgi:lysophospholipase L1-like esterase